MSRTAVVEVTGYEMSEAHKERLAVGREQSRIVRRYLEALQNNRPKRGRRVTAESLESRLATITAQIETEEDPLRRLELVTQRDQIQARLENAGEEVGLSELEKEFVAVAAEYGSRRGITYKAWREIGVQPSVLKAAGITRAG